jgi:hypothetical protein
MVIQPAWAARRWVRQNEGVGLGKEHDDRGKRDEAKGDWLNASKGPGGGGGRTATPAMTAMSAAPEGCPDTERERERK